MERKGGSKKKEEKVTGPPRSIEVIHNIGYHPELSHGKVSLDIYLPKGAQNNDQKVPVVIYAHGGAWQRGDKKRRYIAENININFGRAMAHNGMICAVVNYRLSRPSRILRGLAGAGILTGVLSPLLATAWWLINFLISWFRTNPSSSFSSSLSSFFSLSFLLDWLWEWRFILGGTYAFCFCAVYALIIYIESDVQKNNVKHPTHVLDLAHAINYVRNSATEWGGDPSSIFLAGHSAGGHLFSLLALKPKFYEDAGYDKKELFASLKGVITLSGVFHLGRLKKNIFARIFLLVPAFGFNNDVYREASPVTHAQQKTPFPFLMLNAQKDFHLARDTKDMEKALKEAGSDVTCKVIPHTNHRSILEFIDTPRDRVTPVILEFIKKTLSPSTAEPSDD